MSVTKALLPYSDRIFRFRKPAMKFPRVAEAILGEERRLISERHITATSIKSILGEDCWNRKFSFAFVRNPWDWEISMYHYIVQKKKDQRHEKVVSLGSFDAYIRERYSRPIRIQSDLLDDDNGHCLVDFVGRFEKLNEDFAEATRRIGIKVDLPHANASKRSRDFRWFYSQATFEMVGEAHGDDLVRFGYDTCRF